MRESNSLPPTQSICPFQSNTAEGDIHSGTGFTPAVLDLNGYLMHYCITALLARLEKSIPIRTFADSPSSGIIKVSYS